MSKLGSWETLRERLQNKLKSLKATKWKDEDGDEDGDKESDEENEIDTF